MRSLFVLYAIFPFLAAHDCGFNRSDYTAEWRYDEQTKDVIFSLRVNTEDEEFLSGIAFGQKGKRMDFLGVYVSDGEIGVTDSFVTINGVIRSDSSSNVKSLNLDYDNEVATAEISRPLAASDAYDLDLSDCITFHFPKGGSVFDPTSKKDKKLGETEEQEVCSITTKCGLVRDDPTAAEHSDHGNCSYKGKDFHISWKYDPDEDTVIFDLDQSITEGKRYTAIGIGEKMKDLDIAIVLMENGNFRSLGDYLTGENGLPLRDEVQDFNVNEEKTSTNETSHIQFSRKLETGDDKDKSLDGCISFQFSVDAGSYENETNIEKRKNIPIRHRVCDIKTNCLASSISEQEGRKSSSGIGETSETSSEVTSEVTVPPSAQGNETASTGGISEETETPSGPEEEQTTPKPAEGCPEAHQDLGICQKYFDDYLARVKGWADRHGETMEGQYWKACKLLSKIAHVPTLCCTLYTATCAGKITP